METIHGIESLQDFKNILENNPGQVIIKFGAEWCKPCKQIEGQVVSWFSKMPDTVQTVLVDVDESFEVYAYMKSRKMIRGIPAILMYLKGNTEYTYDDSVSGSNAAEIDMFFQRCLNKKTVFASNMPFPIRLPQAPTPAPAAPATDH
jgi:thioredoxin-like negative regulator of GroEL